MFVLLLLVVLSRIWLPLTTLQLHITHGLQLPSFTALQHTHIHHCTNHTAVTNHSLTLIVLPHLHLIHSLTYKQHTSLHTLRSLVLHRLTFWAFPLYSVYLDCHTLWPFAACLLTLPAFRYPLCLPPTPTFALPLLLILPCLRDTCYCLWPLPVLTLPVWPPLVCNKAAIGSNHTASSLQVLILL